MPASPLGPTPNKEPPNFTPVPHATAVCVLIRALHPPPPAVPKTSTLRAVVEQLRWFAGPPIRNAAALGGNICTASPISGALARLPCDSHAPRSDS